MAEIEFDNLTKRYDDGHEAVNDLCLRIADGEFVILVGPSGCGKSTALRMVAGLEEITSGQLSIGGAVVNDVAPKDRDIAMVFQTYALYPHMTVRQNMAFSLRLAKVGSREIERRVVDAARILDLARHLDRRPANLSGGQRQRVAMGRAIVREPSAFLMDEPLSNLDAKLRVQMRAEIARIQQRLGTTTIYVTHDQIEAMTLGDRVAVMSKGVLQQVDAPNVLYRDPANLFVASFIGSPAMNFFEGELTNGSVRTPIGELPLTDERRRRVERALPSSHEVIVGIRPEHFEDARLVDAQRRQYEFDAPIELTESVGSEVYAHFGYIGWAPPSRDLERLAPNDELQEAAHLASSTRAVARLSPASGVRPHEVIGLCVDIDELHVFDRADGRCLTRQPPGEDARASAGGAMAV
jgi:multiple sugar transport system ATP-binding protein